MTQPVWEFPLMLPRHAFSARDAARAGDVWRWFQEAAVEASTQAGWSPMRYRGEKVAFIVRSMTAVHHREVTYGERTRARTWVSRFRRELFSTREVRLLGEAGLASAATQEWVHVSDALKPVRAPAALLECFPIHQEGVSVELPAWSELEGATHQFTFRCWHTWMDPLDHANHPAYVDWCDEAISQVMHRAGLLPVRLEPVGERLVFKSGVTAEDTITVESTRMGRTSEGDLVLRHRILKNDGVECVTGETIRRLAGGATDSLVRAWDR